MGECNHRKNWYNLGFMSQACQTYLPDRIASLWLVCLPDDLADFLSISPGFRICMYVVLIVSDARTSPELGEVDLWLIARR